jgi:hypothetical protein
VWACPVNVVIWDTENGGNFRTPLEAGNRSPAGGAVRLSADVWEVLAHEIVTVPPDAYLLPPQDNVLFSVGGFFQQLDPPFVIAESKNNALYPVHDSILAYHFEIPLDHQTRIAMK